MKQALLTSAALLGGLAALACASLAAPSLAAGAADIPASVQPDPGTPNIAGVWVMQNRPAALKTLDGKEPPLTAEGKAIYERRAAALKAGDKKIDPINDCIMHGVPRIIYNPYPLRILQEKQRINFVYEANHTFRIVPLGEPLPDEPDPNYLGYSVGKWEGNTLVVDTIGLNTKTWLDYSGLPHSDKLKVQERYTVSGNTIQGRVDITDPEMYSAPWSTSFTLVRRPGLALQESVCMRDHKM